MRYFELERRYDAGEEIRCAVVWNDQLITGGNQNSLHAWNWDGTRSSNKSHTDIVRALILWNNLLVSASYDRSIIVWKKPFEICKKRENAHNDWIYALEVWQDKLVSGSANTVTIWNQNLEQYASVKAESFYLQVVNNLIVILGSAISIWDGDHLFSHSAISTIRGAVKYKNGLLFGNEYKIHYIPNLPTRSFDDFEQKVFDSKHSTNVWGMGLWNNTVLSGSRNTIMIHKIEDGKLLDSWQPHTDWIRAILKWRNRLITASDDHTVAFWKGLSILYLADS